MTAVHKAVLLRFMRSIGCLPCSDPTRYSLHHVLKSLECSACDRSNQCTQPGKRRAQLAVGAAQRAKFSNSIWMSGGPCARSGSRYRSDFTDCRRVRPRQSTRARFCTEWRPLRGGSGQGWRVGCSLDPGWRRTESAAVLLWHHWCNYAREQWRAGADRDGSAVTCSTGR